MCKCYQEGLCAMQNCPAIVAVGRTKFGEHYGKEPEKLIEEAWLAASRDCGLERKDLEACYMSDCFLPITNKLGLEEGFLSELTELHVPMEVTRSVSAALLTACHAIRAGVYSTVLVGGIEKMTDRWDKIRDDLMLLEDPWSYYAGGTPNQTMNSCSEHTSKNTASQAKTSRNSTLPSHRSQSKTTPTQQKTSTPNTKEK